METAIWIGIAFCITQSAMFSGLNLAFFSISKLRLEVESGKNNPDALKILSLREDANFLLTTILWGNVGINVLLTLLSNSVMAGLLAFVFSTVVITFVGEIIPQAYFSRHAMKTAAFLAPVLRFYQKLLYPFAKPTAVVLDKWLGPEGIRFYNERDLKEMIRMHSVSKDTDIDRVEGTGAINFLALDDVKVENEGEELDDQSIIRLSFDGRLPKFPEVGNTPNDPFLKDMQKSGKKWAVIVDESGKPGAVVDTDAFIREALFSRDTFNPYRHCHRPIVVQDSEINLGKIISRFKVRKEHPEDDVVDDDMVLFWGKSRRVITGSDILGRLLRGIVEADRRAEPIDASQSESG